jgi:hypothetical protein
MAKAKKTRNKAKTAIEAMKKEALTRSALSAPDPAYEFYISTCCGRVIVSGTYDGSIRASAGELVRFTYVGDASYGGFLITATELKKNNNKGNASKKEPFHDPLPTGVVTEFQSKLKAGSGNQRLLKYKINVGNLIAADPVIIIER